MEKEKTKKIWKIIGIVFGVSILALISLTITFLDVLNVINYQPAPEPQKPPINKPPRPPININPYTDEEIWNILSQKQVLVKQTRKYNNENNVQKQEINYFVGLVSDIETEGNTRLFYPSKYCNEIKVAGNKVYKYNENIFEVASINDSIGKTLSEIKWNNIYSSNTLKPNYLNLISLTVLGLSYINLNLTSINNDTQDNKINKMLKNDDQLYYGDELLSTIYIQDNRVKYFLGELNDLKYQYDTKAILLNNFYYYDNNIHSVPIFPYSEILEQNNIPFARINMLKTWNDNSQIIDGSYVVSRDGLVMWASYGLNNLTNTCDFLYTGGIHYAHFRY